MNLSSHKECIYSTWRKHGSLMTLLIPGILFFLIFKYIPMTGVIVAFKDFRLDLGIMGSPYCGLDNFRRLFIGPEFGQAIRNTLVLSILNLTFGFSAPIILALLLNEIRISAYKRCIQTLTYLPFLFSWVVLGGIFLMMFNRTGPINSMLGSFGILPIPFLTEGYWFIAVIIGTGIWKGMGYGAVIYLAALSGVDQNLYDAAAIDGAGRWKQMVHITMPVLVPTISVLLILNLGNLLRVGFDQIFNMYNPMVYDVSDVIGTYTLRRMISGEFELAAASDLFQSVVGLILIVLANMVVNKMSKGEQGLW